MLRRRNVLRLTSALLMCLLLSGCTPFYAVSDLLSPPQFSEENAALRKAFEAQAGKNVQYKSPVSGENLSAFLLEDLDADGEREALVFYTPDSMDSTVRIGVLSCTDGNWQRVQDLEGGGSDVYSAEILDMDADGQPEVIVCFGTPEGGHVMSIFTCASAPFSLVKLSERGYTAMCRADLNGDGQTQIFTIYLYAENGSRTAQARVLQKTQNGILTLDKCYLDGKVTGYGEMFLCPTDTGCVLYADAYRGENEMLTEVIVWDRETASLRVPLLDDETRSNTQTVRHSHIVCRDLDGDDVPEIPCQSSAFPYGEIVQNGAVVASQIYLTQWCAFRGDRLEPVRQSLVHTNGKYMFTIPTSWTGRFSVVQYPEKQQWDFYHIDPATGERIGYLFSALFTTHTKWMQTRDALSDYTPLRSEGEDMLLVYGINTESPLQLSEEMLQDAFMILR